MNIPKKPRYNLVMRVVSEFFSSENITDFPVDPFKIIKRNRWGLVKYSELANKHEVSVQEIIDEFQTEDACVIRIKNIYTIAYNDTMESTTRIRFTLMHEIGHIVLGHLVEFEETTFNRGGLTESEYDVLEREANAFARNVLAPPFIVEKLNGNSHRFLIDDTSGFFNISQAAVRTRLQMLSWDLQHISAHIPALLTRFQGYINSILDSKQCVRCSHLFINRFASHCPICSHTRFVKKRGENIMIYSGFIVDENSRLIECACCNNEEIGDYDVFCKVCSYPLVNKCTSIEYGYGGSIEWKCEELAAGNARYCTKCGGETVFFNRGILIAWDKEIAEIKEREREEIEAMFIEL